VEFSKVQIKQLCQEYAIKATRDITQSMKSLEKEIVELYELAENHRLEYMDKPSAMSPIDFWRAVLKLKSSPSSEWAVSETTPPTPS